MHASGSNVIVRFFLWRAVLCVVCGQCLSVFVFVHGKELLWQSVEIQKYERPTLLFLYFCFLRYYGYRCIIIEEDVVCFLAS